MVLSIAFILSFVLSAIVLLIGILIFSDISEAMALTLPVLDVDSIFQLEQNGIGSNQPIASATVNMASIYSGLIGGDVVTKVTVPMSNLTSLITVEDTLRTDLASTSTNQNQVLANAVAGNMFWQDRIPAGAQIHQMAIHLDAVTSFGGGGFSEPMLIVIYDHTFSTTLIPLANGKSQIKVFSTTSPEIGTKIYFTFNPPVTVPPDGDIIPAVFIGGTGNLELTRSTPSSTLYKSGFESFSGSSLNPTVFTVFAGGENIWFGAKYTIPQPFDIGLYDSSNNLLGSSSGIATTNVAQNLEVAFSSTPIPNDGIIKVGIFGEGINYLGDTTVTEVDVGVAGLPNPFVSDGTTASTQRTTLQIEHTAVNSQNNLNQVDKFNNALNIGFTVIGILPVALFFALFAIFSGRTESF